MTVSHTLQVVRVWQVTQPVNEQDWQIWAVELIKYPASSLHVLQAIRELQSEHPIKGHFKQDGPATGKKSLATSQVKQVVKLSQVEHPRMLQD